MLDTDTKRRINTCRDILVGKVPDPKSQVEQITIALIYKFMDDMDLESEEMGGARKFFTGDFERYAWSKLVASGVGGQEMLNTYSEALTRMVENAGIPELFRSIFRNAYLPYRDPETLRSFLREIDGFKYDHSERLGDAFEYLLSVLGSQGDAGQFRTPRHIIDFMVEIIDPKKDETIMDPACGTAGFLISSYKHILKANSTEVAGANGTGVADVSELALESPLRFKGDLLSPEERTRLAGNVNGYDISPDMVRLSLVNLYLHGFADPKVEEYDTLTSDDKWNEMADVILANPPFMSPKGGIRPHNRFQVQSKRSEVLFVDYIAEHLTPQGRAAIIVPEGIVFQSQGAYCALRKLLVDKFLIAVVSLPAGVFNPYSGVKTSILILDRAAAKASDRVAFFKIENDGFGLGAQRRAVKGSQLPQVTTELGAWLAAVRGGGDAVIESALGFAVERARIADGGEYNLAGERYGATKERTSNWPMVRLGDLVSSKSGNSTIIKGTLPTEPGDGLYSAYSATGQDVFAPTFAHEGPGIVISAVGARCGKCFRADGKWQPIANTHAMIADEKVALTDYLFLFLNNENFWVKGGSAQPFVKVKASLEIKIPLPPLEVQRGIVAEIEGYQRVIDGAHAVLDNYRPHIPIDPAWEMAPIGDFILSSGVGLVKNKGEQHDSFAHPYLKMNNIMIEGLLNFAKVDRVEAGPNELARYALDDGDFIYNTRNSPELVGKSAVYHGPSGQILFNNNILRIKFDHRLHSDYVNWILNSAAGKKKIRSLVDGTTSVAALYQRNFETIEIPLPPLETQQAIVAEIEAEQAVVAANRELVARFETKIETAIARVWGEAKAVSGAEGALATQSELEPA